MLDEVKGHTILVIRAQRQWAGMYKTCHLGTIAKSSRNAKFIDPFDVEETSAMVKMNEGIGDKVA